MSTNAIHEMSLEHRRIGQVIDMLEQAQKALAEGGAVRVEILRKIAEFLRVYADLRHHHREEDVLFPLLVERGVPPGGCPLGGLAHGHVQGRELLKQMEDKAAIYEQDSQSGSAALQQTLGDLVGMYRHHLWMEDMMVFPMAEKMVDEKDHATMLASFAKIDEGIGTEKIAALEKFADSGAAAAAK